MSYLYSFLFCSNLNGFRKNEESNENKEDSIQETGHNFSPDIAVRVTLVRPPLGNHRGQKASHESCAVEKHVEGVGY